MSYSEYCARLTPEPRLRDIVAVAGGLATVLGAALLAFLPIALHWRIVAVLGWLAWHGVEGRRLLLGFRGCAGLRIEGCGGVEIIAPDGVRRRATLLPGSVVGRRLAWLRLQRTDGVRHVEFLAGNALKNKEWRRFLVIWRHLGAAQ